MSHFGFSHFCGTLSQVICIHFLIFSSYSTVTQYFEDMGLLSRPKFLGPTLAIVIIEFSLSITVNVIKFQHFFLSVLKLLVFLHRFRLTQFLSVKL